MMLILDDLMMRCSSYYKKGLNRIVLYINLYLKKIHLIIFFFNPTILMYKYFTVLHKIKTHIFGYFSIRTH